MGSVVRWHEAETMRLMELGVGVLTYRGWDAVAAQLTAEFGGRFTSNGCRVKYQSLPNRPDRGFAERVDAAKQQLSARLQAEADRALLKERALQDILLDTLRDSIRPLEFRQPKFAPPKSASDHEEQAVLLLSDLHFGKRTPRYNLETARQRVARAFQKVREIVALHRRAYRIRNLHILWGGDIIDGESIYPTQPHHLDAPLVGQIVATTSTIVEELSTLAGYFERVNNYCVRGNHGRLSKFAYEGSNFDAILYHFMRMATDKIPNLSWTIPDDWHLMAKIGGRKVLLIHGDQIKMQLNLPWYGITTRVSRWASTLGLSDFNIACMGHFHTSSTLRWNDKEIFTNGTAVAGDDFALEKIGLESSECCWLFGVSDHRTTWKYELDYRE